MVQGTASSVGKSMLVTALCRIFADAGVRVAPFKAQNMSNNSYVTPDGLEIGRAQAEQARAARIAPDVRMNPVLLKPEADLRAQVVVLGRPAGTLSARYFERKRRLWPHVRDALDSLRAQYELVLIEGAGSPAEVNLRHGDIVNMRVATYARSPVLLVGDIDRGGVFAHFVGTLALLTREERELVKAFVINKFRGDLGLLEPGLRFLEKRTRRPVLGVVPYLPDLRLADEDAVALEHGREQREGQLEVAVVHLPHISNFDDFDALGAEAGVRLRYVRDAAGLAGSDLIILPGTKNTRADLQWLIARGLDRAIGHAVEGGAALIGICGGFQMLGRRLADPEGVEEQPGEDEGLGLLPFETEFRQAKVTMQVTAEVSAGRGLLAGMEGAPLHAYEIHMGISTGNGEPAFRIFRGASEEPAAPDGAISDDGFILGCYLHGLFANDALRQGILHNIAMKRGKEVSFNGRWDPEAGLDELARQLRAAIDLEALRGIVGS